MYVLGWVEGAVKFVRRLLLCLSAELTAIVNTAQLHSAEQHHSIRDFYAWWWWSCGTPEHELRVGETFPGTGMCIFLSSNFNDSFHWIVWSKASLLCEKVPTSKSSTINRLG